ncbi:MAG: DUF1801 domain-containing protein [Flavobacteriaceae bacterium]|nr:MAG: DUF1801 domain-containing protein [Flavobacteriaceae bacterium]
MNPAEHYILNQPEPFKSILLQLQILIEAAYPEVDLKYKWKIPYYYLHNKPFCFLNVSKGYVDVGLWLPYLIEGLSPYLISEGRKKMKSLRYYTIEEIDPKILFKALEEVHKNYQKGFWKG